MVRATSESVTLIRPSKAAAAIECSATLTLTVGMAETSSSYAKEGSAAHHAAEQILLGRVPPAFVEIDGEEILITEEMLDAVQPYVDLANSIWEPGDTTKIEAPVNLAWLWTPLAPPLAVRGTADFVNYSPKTRVLTILDLKFGRGHIVSPEWNAQEMLYALGVMGELKEQPEIIRLMICQPRAPGETVKVWEIGVKALLDWFHAVFIPAVNRIAAGDTTEKINDGCRWCLRKSECGALREQSLAVAKSQFSAHPMPTAEMSGAELADVLTKAEIVSIFVEGVRAEAQRRLESGGAVPGFMLQPKRATRRWISNDDATAALLGAGISPDDVLSPAEIRSPAQVEKTLKKLGKTALLQDLVVAVSSGNNVVPTGKARGGVDAISDS